MGKALDPDLPKLGAQLASEFESLDEVSSPNAYAVKIRANEAGCCAVPQPQGIKALEKASSNAVPWPEHCSGFLHRSGGHRSTRQVVLRSDRRRSNALKCPPSDEQPTIPFLERASQQRFPVTNCVRVDFSTGGYRR